jgi:isopentenyldiphosphate isomerase
MEIVDVVNELDNVVGQLPKTEAIQNGAWTRVVFVILFNQKGELFLQQRKSTKKTYPLYWSGSASGHVQSGESYAKAAIRELAEELGVNTALTEVAKWNSAQEKEVVTFFVGREEGPFQLEESSIEQASFFSVEKLENDSAGMKMTSYLSKVLPLMKAQLTSQPDQTPQ